MSVFSNTLKLATKRFSLVAITTFVAFISVVYEVHASVIYEILYSFGTIPSGVFIKYKLLNGAVLLSLFTLTTITTDRSLLSNNFFRLYLFIILFMLAVVLLNSDLYGYSSTDRETSSSSQEFWFPLLFKYSVYMVIGYYLMRTAIFRHFYLIFTILLSLTVLSHVNYETLSIARENYIAGANRGNYLFLGDATALSFLLLLAFYRHNFLRLILITASLGVIFLIGSRTSFVAYTATILIYIFLTLKIKNSPVIAVCLVASLIAFHSTDFYELSLRNERMSNLFLGIEDDSSVLGRAELLALGWEDITSNPILGVFGGQLDTSASHWRAYMHNILSYWRQFGIVVLICILIFQYKLMQLLSLAIRHRHSTEYALLFMICFFIAVEVAFSRSFAFSQSHIYFGLIIAMSRIGASPSADHGNRSVPKTVAIKQKRKRRRKKRSSRSGS